jgi:hypothetical protein
MMAARLESIQVIVYVEGLHRCVSRKPRLLPRYEPTRDEICSIEHDKS